MSSNGMYVLKCLAKEIWPLQGKGRIQKKPKYDLIIAAEQKQDLMVRN